MENMNELEEMRQQISALKQRLDHETTLNESLLRDSLRTKMNSIEKIVMRQIIAGFITTIAWMLIGEAMGLSIYFIIFTCVMLVANIASEYFTNRMDSINSTTNLVETAHKLAKMKEMRLQRSIIGISVLMLVWVPWLTYEFHATMPAEKFRLMTIAGGIGLCIGTTIGLHILFKMQRANDEMIRQIEEATRE